jgi:energy-coupling factor transporter ATP-binding protein EcfA2
VAFLIGALIPSGPYPILVLNGEQGSGKSTLARLLRQLIDPNRANTRQPPCNDDALLVAAENGWLLNFDNLSNISPRLSEALCRISTGAGFGRRRFYTNTDEVIVNVSRPVIINGIPELAVHADLADRALFIQLPPMSSEIRRPESEYWADFNSAAPGIFGALLKGVSAALRNQGQVRLDGLPRMADFARRVVAALPAVGLEPDQFVAAYESNRDQASVALAETDPVAIAITRIVDDGGGSWDGTSADLLQDFDHLLSDAPIFRVLPKSPSAIALL